MYRWFPRLIVEISDYINLFKPNNKIKSHNNNLKTLQIMKHYFLNEKTENGIVTLNHFNTIEDAEFALSELENATEVDTFEEDGETVEMEVYSNTTDELYISTRPSDDYKEAHAEEFAAEAAAEKAAKAEAKAKAKAEKEAAKLAAAQATTEEEITDFSLTEAADETEEDEIEDADETEADEQ